MVDTTNSFKNSISVFRNDNKTPENKQPHFRGTIELSNEIIDALKETNSYKIDLALWKREANGKSYLSGQVQLPYALRKEEIAPKQEPQSFDDLKDDDPLPF